MSLTASKVQEPDQRHLRWKCILCGLATDVFSMSCTNITASEGCYTDYTSHVEGMMACFVVKDMLRGFTIAVPEAKQTANIIANSVIHHGSANKESNRSSYSKSCTEALNLHYG